MVIRPEYTTGYIERSVVPSINWFFDLAISGLRIVANMSKAKDLSATKWWKGMVRVWITHFQGRLNILEFKDILTSSDLLAVESLLNKVEPLHVEFKDHHYSMLWSILKGMMSWY